MKHMHDSRMHETNRTKSRNSQGMTLVELLVSLVILMVVLGAVYSILHLQQTKSSQVTRTTILQTDAQVAFTLVKWDLLLAGLGFPFGRQDAFQLSNSGGNVTLRATGLGFEMNHTQW
ncbi:MAG: prepilin-type N-terminal cleavage/methylation domain-containing protein, partial [bacterium]